MKSINLNKRIFREYLRHLVRSIIFWTLSMIAFAFLRYFAISDEIGIQIQTEYLSAYDLSPILFFFGISGIMAGILYATIEFGIEKYLLKKFALIWGIIIQMVLVSLSVILVANLMIELSPKILGTLLEDQSKWWYEDRSFYPIFFFIPIASFVFAMMVMVLDKFGPHTFYKLLIGKYKQPREEWRVFMFLDLKKSTTIAEQIGHLKFSELLQDCFYDLNELVSQYEAEIYQYVGDEVVLSWKYSRGIYKENCLGIFFDFKRKLQLKTTFYKAKYGLIPEFKAGLHGGRVVATEIGFIKKELAYHGDVVNTASRIQGACNHYEVPILVSEKLADDLVVPKRFESKLMGKVLLKGKQKEINIHTIYQKKDMPYLMKKQHKPEFMPPYIRALGK